MKHPVIIRLVPALLFAASAFAGEEPKKDIVIRRHLSVDSPHFNEELPKEKVAFLGVETMPVNRTVAVQLGLPPDTGLVVRRVADGSPAADLLKEHDILTRLDDQILIDMHQLSVLVRSRKAGDEVKLTLLRGGKEVVLKAKLAEHEVPKLAEGGMPGPFGMMGDNAFFFQQGGPALPELAGPEAGDVMRLIGRERNHWFAKPRIHMFKRHEGKGATILDLPSGNFVFSDDEGSVEVNSSDGKRELTVKNKKGDVTFHGPLNSPADHEKLPAEVVARLNAIGGADLDLDDDGDNLEVETKVLNPATKTRQELPAREAGADLRTL